MLQKRTWVFSAKRQGAGQRRSSALALQQKPNPAERSTSTSKSRERAVLLRRWVMNGPSPPPLPCQAWTTSTREPKCLGKLPSPECKLDTSFPTPPALNLRPCKHPAHRSPASRGGSSARPTLYKGPGDRRKRGGTDPLPCDVVLDQPSVDPSPSERAPERADSQRKVF